MQDGLLAANNKNKMLQTHGSGPLSCSSCKKREVGDLGLLLGCVLCFLSDGGSNGGWGSYRRSAMAWTSAELGTVEEMAVLAPVVEAAIKTLPWRPKTGMHHLPVVRCASRPGLRIANLAAATPGSRICPAGPDVVRLPQDCGAWCSMHPRGGKPANDRAPAPVRTV